jgi:hypothetical protein
MTNCVIAECVKAGAIPNVASASSLECHNGKVRRVTNSLNCFFNIVASVQSGAIRGDQKRFTNASSKKLVDYDVLKPLPSGGFIRI